jgi:dipeptidyl aminopeptidase/acylaminoacyl peptidase
MERALSAAGKSVELIRVRKDGHNFGKPESLLVLIKEIQRFLDQHIGH